MFYTVYMGRKENYPLHMRSPVDRAAPVNESRLTPQSFVKISMCSYEGARWLGYRDLGFSNRDLGKRAGSFAI